MEIGTMELGKKIDAAMKRIRKAEKRTERDNRSVGASLSYLYGGYCALEEQIHANISTADPLAQIDDLRDVVGALTATVEDIGDEVCHSNVIEDMGTIRASIKELEGVVSDLHDDLISGVVTMDARVERLESVNAMRTTSEYLDRKLNGISVGASLRRIPLPSLHDAVGTVVVSALVAAIVFISVTQ